MRWTDSTVMSIAFIFPSAALLQRRLLQTDTKLLDIISLLLYPPHSTKDRSGPVLAVLELQDRRPDHRSGPSKIEDHGLDCGPDQRPVPRPVLDRTTETLPPNTEFDDAITLFPSEKQPTSFAILSDGALQPSS
jgi:hypothetical protein